MPQKCPSLGDGRKDDGEDIARQFIGVLGRTDIYRRSHQPRHDARRRRRASLDAIRRRDIVYRIDANAWGWATQAHGAIGRGDERIGADSV